MTRSKMYTTTMAGQKATRRNTRQDRLLGHGSGEQLDLDEAIAKHMMRFCHLTPMLFCSCDE